MERKSLFVEVILPLAIRDTYTYRIPQELMNEAAIGKRVIVQFGKNKLYSAIIYKITEQAPERYEAKYILDVLDEKPIVTASQIKLWEWISSYYLCNLGEVMQAAMPAALKLASETKITKGELEADRCFLPEKEFLILEALDMVHELKISDVVQLLGQKTVFPILRQLFDQGLITIVEEITTKYKPRKQAFIKLAPEFLTETRKKELLDSLNRAPKQQDVVLAWMQLNKSEGKISKKKLLETANVSSSVLLSLIEKGILVQEDLIVSRIGYDDEFDDLINFELSKLQQEAFQAIKLSFQSRDVALLHGVTSSGKTQLYIRLIEEILEAGKQVLFLLPEIALTTQMTERLKQHFGSVLGVYHSRFNDNERAELWQKVLNGTVKLIVGARSSVFLPFVNLGLIVVDEEHEASYKQVDPSPRYHARDTAIFLGHMFGAKVLLGSATPSLESYYNAKAEKYGLINLNERYGQSVLPDIEVVSIKEATRKEQMTGYFSQTLLKAMEDAIGRKKQVILFQNRRGHTPLLQCKTCGFIAKCLHCDVSLNYHRSTAKLHCHYCGYTEDPLKICTACGSAHLESKGFGTEKLEEELQLLLPEISIGRLDLDSAKGKHGFENVLSEFAEQKFQVLIGTQMVAKGLDFGNVSVIGVVMADSLIHYPEFRAYERAFAMLSQVSGRAGRRAEKGKVIIQTYNPEHRVIQQVVAHDYEHMFSVEINERKNFDYPPFFRMIRLDVRHQNQDVAKGAADHLAWMLRQSLGTRVLGPEQPLVSRIRNQYIQSILLKIERKGISIVKVKDFVRHSMSQFAADKRFKGSRIYVDVDPY